MMAMQRDCRARLPFVLVILAILTVGRVDVAFAGMGPSPMGVGPSQMEDWNGDPRIALVIGNSAYEGPPLNSPLTDAEYIAGLFSRLGFEVESGTDLGSEEMAELFRRFAARARQAEIATIYYSGLSWAGDGEQWLLPVDADFGSSFALRREAFSLSMILDAMEGAEAKLLFLDTDCSALAQARNDAFRGALFACAAAPWRSTYDSEQEGDFSPFASALLDLLEKPGELRTLLARTALSMAETSYGGERRKQTPWVLDLLPRDIHLYRPGLTALPDGGLATTGAYSEVFRAAGRLPDGGAIIVGSTGKQEAQHIRLVRLDAKGAVRWNRILEAEPWDSLTSIVPAPDGGFLAVGETVYRTEYGPDGWAVKLTASGDIEWERSFGGKRGHSLQAVVPVEGGDFVAVGTSEAEDAGSYAWAIRFGAGGALVWERRFEGAGRSRLESVAIVPEGDALVAAGHTRPTADRNLDSWVVKFDLDGEVIWERTISGSAHDWLISIAPIGVAGDLIAVGTTGSPKGIDGVGWAIRLNEVGEVLWQRGYSEEELGAFWSMAALGGDVVATTRPIMPEDGKEEIARLDGDGDIKWRSEMPKGATKAGKPWANALTPLSDDLLIAAGTLAPRDDEPGSRGWLGGFRASGEFADLPVLLPRPARQSTSGSK